MDQTGGIVDYLPRYRLEMESFEFNQLDGATQCANGIFAAFQFDVDDVPQRPSETTHDSLYTHSRPSIVIFHQRFC